MWHCTHFRLLEIIMRRLKSKEELRLHVRDWMTQRWRGTKQIYYMEGVKAIGTVGFSQQSKCAVGSNTVEILPLCEELLWLIWTKTLWPYGFWQKQISFNGCYWRGKDIVTQLGRLFSDEEHLTTIAKTVFVNGPASTTYIRHSSKVEYAQLLSA